MNIEKNVEKRKIKTEETREKISLRDGEKGRSVVICHVISSQGTQAFRRIPLLRKKLNVGYEERITTHAVRRFC